MASALRFTVQASTFTSAFVRRPVKPTLRPQINLKLRKGVPFVTAMATANAGLGKETPESKWKEVLSTEEYQILRQKGTEPAGSGQYNKFYKEGEYHCAGCGTLLYKSDTKFDSGCGWPAFYAEVPGAVDRHVDNTYGMKRTEITCSNCGGHLGHVFEGEGFKTPTDERHCVNSKSLKFAPPK